MEGLELACFNIIANVGTAKSTYLEALDLAKEGKYEEAEAKVAEGYQFDTEGHKAHMELITKEANGEVVVPTMLLIHAEDQLNSAEIIKTMVDEMIVLLKKVDNK